MRRDAPDRPSSNERLYNWQWRKESKAFLRENPLCYYCGLQGRTTAATCVDHAEPHRGDPEKFWNRRNWRASCGPCNSAKAARDEGGFGNRRRL